MGAHRAALRSTFGPTLVAATALALLASALLLAAPAFAATGTYVRLAQLTGDMAGTDLVLSSASDPGRSVTIPGEQYGGLSEYRLVQPGDYVVGMVPAGGGGTPAVSLTLNAMSGTSYTLAAVDRSANPAGLSVLTDDLTPPPAGQAKLRVIGGAPGSPVLDVRGPAGDVAIGLPYAGASGYRDLPSGPTTLTVGSPGGPTVQLPVDLSPNQVASAVLVDRDGTLAADVRVDAEGPTRVPPGAIKAGYGGAAPTDVTGVLTFGLLAAAAAAAAVVLGRRSGGARQRS